MQEQAHLIGLEAVTGGAIRFQGQLVVFDIVFHLATGTGDWPVKHLGAGLLHIRHDTACVDALVGHFALDDYTARVRPGSRLVARRVKAGGPFYPSAPRPAWLARRPLGPAPVTPC